MTWDLLGWIFGIGAVVGYFTLGGLCAYWLLTPSR